MAGQTEISELCQKEEDKNEIKSNIDESDIVNYEDDDNGDKQYSFSNIKRYSRYDLLTLRNAQQSIHYPNCALRPDLQALSIWTCRLRCDLQYLGLWKISNAGNLYANYSCNGSCQSYSCNDGQPYPSSSSQTSTSNSQMCYGNVQQGQQVQPMQTTSSSPTLGSKRAVRSRERFLNYQRCINTELTRAVSPGGSGESSAQHHVNHQIKSTFIDQRSISSSHLMPAFAKRRMGHASALHSQTDNSNFNNNTEQFSNDDGSCEGSGHFDSTIKSRKDSTKTTNNQNDYHIYKSSPNSRLEKNEHLGESQAGWMNLVKKINSEYPMPNNKNTNASSVNKKLIYEKRIGSGRLVPREVNWDMRTGSNKEKDNNVHTNSSNSNGEKEKVIVGEVDKLNNRNSSLARYSEGRGQERRIFDRRISNPDDSNNCGNSSASKRYTSTNLGEERNNFDVNYQQQSQHFTGQRSMSFRRREYAEHKDHHRDFRDFRDPKDIRESREHREQHHHNHHRDHKEEPEWFSEGPTSQHDTIELRGFEENDESQQQEQNYLCQYSKIERKTSESSLLSHNSSNNANLSTKENLDISSEVSNNSNNTTTSDKEIDNNTSGNNAKDTPTPNNETTGVNELSTDTQQNAIAKLEEVENSEQRRSNASELFFDQFLNIDALENSLIGNVTDQSIHPNNDGGGTSRFSRWFFNNSTNNLNNNEELNNNPPNKGDSKRQNKDINESDFNSFITFLKCNNFPTPELPKGLPSNVSALSVEELEARMRKMDSGDIEKTKCHESNQNFNKNDGGQIKTSESDNEPDSSPHSTEINTQDVEAFRKLLDQLGKPRVDISMNIILPNAPGQQHILTPPVGVYPTGISPLPSNTLHPQSKQEYMMKMMHQQHLMHQQQNMGKIVPPLMLPHHRITQISPQQQTENLPLLSAPHHPHMPMIPGHPQKRLDVQHLIQSVLREELSRSFLEKELTNPNIPPYTKEIIATVLNETSRYNQSNAGGSNASESLENTAKNDISTAPNNLMQSLAKGEVSLNLLEHELNKLNMGMCNDTSNNGNFKDRSRCGTPLATPLNPVSIPTSGGVIVPLPHQVVTAQKQNENLCSNLAEQQHQQAMSSMLCSHHEDSTMHMPTQRELQMHTQAIMQNAIFKKKLEVEQHEAIRRRQEIHKQQELESSNINHQQSLNVNSVVSQQSHQQPPRHINSPTPLAFTPTSVLRKMTAEKDTVTNTSQAPPITSSSPQQIQPHLQQPHLKIPTHPQIHNQQMYQHSNQPRMILGGGNFQYMHQQPQHQIIPSSGSPQVSPQQKSQIRNQPTGPLKWPLITHSTIEQNHAILNNMNNKPMGRPILKGPGPIQPLVPQNTHNPMGQNQSNINQNSQSIQTVSQIQTIPQIQKYPSIQQPRQIVGQQFSTHIIQHQIPTSQQNNLQQQLFQQQRPVVMQRQQIQQNDLGNHAGLPPQASIHHQSCNDSNSVANLNYQRDGGLSPTSNQLAQWFSPELLAQASAGKLPLLNMNQALSLEEFERSIQHSSTAVNN
ncbi:eIF4E-Transporter [Cochliomyia hominivorax]